MTMKTKRGLAVGGGTALCAALAVLITMRFTPDSKPTTDSAPTPTSSSSSQISAEVTASKHEETKPAAQDNSSAITQSEVHENNNADESSVTEVVQNFPESKKESVPPAPPKIEDEETLTNPNSEPTYESDQTEVNPQSETSSDTPKHGDRKDGKIYINGFGWIDDEGGGGIGYTDDGMYQNGNKIGSFG